MKKEFEQKDLILSKLTLDFITEMVFWIDSQGKFFMVNEAACKNLAYSKEELLDLSVPDVDQKNSMEYFQEKWKEIEREGKVSFEIFFTTKTESSFPAEITANFVEFEGGKYLCAVARDISERKEVKDILLASEERYRKLFESANDAIFLMDERKFLECNEKTLHIYGCKDKTEIIGHSPWEFSPQKQPDGSLSIKKAKTLIMNAFNGEHQKFYWKHTRLDGDEFDAEVSLRRIAIRDKVFLQAIVRDKTDETAALNALKESEEKFNRAFNTNPISLHITTIPEGRFVEVNPLFEELSGFKKEELIGKTSVEMGFYVQSEDRENLFNELKAKGKLSDYEIVFKVRSGDHRLCRVFSEIVDIEGKPHLLSLVQDITEQRKAEESLQNERNLLRSIIDSIPDHIYIKDTKHRFIMSNAFTLDRFSVKEQDDIIGKTDLDFLDKSLAEEFHDEERELFRTGIPITDKLIKSRDKEIWGLHSKFPLKDIHGNLIGLIGYNKDITELKLAEIELQKEKDFVDQILNTVVDTIFVFNPKTGKPIRWNKAFNDISGFTDKEISQKTAPDDWYSKEDLEEAADTMSLMLQGKSSVIEMSLITKSGDRIQTEYTSSMTVDTEGQPQYIIGVGRDITERKKAEEALKESEEKFRTIAETSPDAATTTDLEGKIIFVSNRTAEIHGFKDPSEMIGLNAFELVIPEGRQKAIQEFETGFTKGTSRDIEFKLLRKNGSIFDGSLSGSILRDGSGNPIGSIIISRDISERKMAEKALIESEERYRLIIENIPTVAWKTSKDGHTTFISSNIEKVYGYAPGEIYEGGESLFFERIHKEDKELVHKSFADLFEKGIEYNVEYRLQKKDGTWIWINDRARIVREEEGMQFAYGVFSDITKRKNAENKMRESEARNRATVEAIPDLLFRFDKKGTYLDVAGPEADLFLPAEELIGKRFTDVIPGEVSTILMQEITNVLNKKQFASIEYSLPTMTGEIQYFEGRISPINSEEVLFIARNITEKKKAEENIQIYQQNLRSMAAELNLTEEKERRRIAINLHDHLSQSLAMAKIKLTGLKKESLSGKISETVKDVNRFITDAIESSRSITYELSPPVLYELGLVHAIQWKLENLEKDHQLTTNLTVEGDITDLNVDHQILIFRAVSELFNNIIKHADATRIDVSVWEENERIKIGVKDDGKGFDPENISVASSEKGGFGLFSIQERLGYFNGMLEIASEKGSGTSVKITIPIQS